MHPVQPNNQVMLNLGAMAEGEAPSPELKGLMARVAISSLTARRLFVRTIRRTAVYETRMYGGVGGEKPRGSPLSRLRLKAGSVRLRRTHLHARWDRPPVARGAAPCPPHLASLRTSLATRNSSERMARFHALSTPTHKRRVSSQCRLKAWGLLIPYRGL